MLAVTALSALLLHAAAPAADIRLPHTELRVIVRTEGVSPADNRLLTRGLAAAADIWRPYVDVSFVRSADPDDAALLPRGALELVITAQTLAGQDPGSLGWIAFTNGRPAPKISVSITAARHLLEQSSWRDRPLMALPPSIRESFLEQAIGRSVAHEIGHYLLRSSVHTTHGLMRARLVSADLMDGRRDHVLLEPSDVMRLQQGLLMVARERAGADLVDP